VEERAEAPTGNVNLAGGEVHAAGGEVDRLEVLEQQVRQLTSRLAGWVEAQLVQALEDRRNDMKALRTELQVVFNEQLAGFRAESASILSVATRRLEVAQEQLAERLDAVAERATAPSDAQLRDEIEALRAEMHAARGGPADDGLEQRVRSAMTRLSESVEAKLAEVTTARRTEHDDLRERLDDAARQAATAAAGVQALRAEIESRASGMEALEQRARTAMGRLSDSMETRLADLAGTRQAELDGLRAELQKVLAQQGSELRTEVTTASAALRARVGQVQERIDGLEEQRNEADDRVGRIVDAKVAEVVERRKTELDEMKHELQEALAKQLSEARAEIGTSVSDAHRRFLDSVERIDETVVSNGRRIEALELHTRRTDERLTELVDAKLAEVGDLRAAEREQLKSELEEAMAAQVHDARTDIGTVVADAHRRFLDSVERLDEQMAVATRQAQAAIAGVETVRDAPGRIDALEEHTRRTDERLSELVEAKLGELAAERLADLDEFRAQLRNALDAHLAETRADVGAAVGEGREELAAGAARLDRQEAALAEAAERLNQSVESKLVELDGVAERLLKTHEDTAQRLFKAQAEMAAVVASAGETATQARDEVQAGLKSLGAQVDAIAAATAKAAFAEEGALAPVRSDVRLLRDQVAELAQLVAELRPRPKPAAAPPTRAEERALALAAKRAAVAKPAAPRKAPVKAALNAAVPAMTPKATKKTAKAAKAAKAVRRRPAAQ
jgi:chromosome segregation ATPase